MNSDYTKDRKTTITFDEKQLPGTPPESITTLTDINNNNNNNNDKEIKPQELADKLSDVHSNLLPKSQIIIILLTLSLANIVSFMDQTGITIGLSIISKDLNAQQSINWAGSASLLANTVCQVLFGRMSDIFGRKKIILICLMILVIGDISCSLARNGIEFFIFRALAGIGNGGVSSLSMVILSDIVSLKDRGKYQGILGASVGIGNAIGPFIMGAFIKYNNNNWRCYYYFLAPLGFIVNIILFFCLKNNHKHKNNHKDKKLNDVISRKEKFLNIDYMGILMATSSLTLILIPLNGGGSTYNWNSNLVIIMFTIGGLLLLGFLLIEWKFAKLPMIPLELFKNPSLCLLYLATFCFGATYFSFIYYLPYHFQIIKNKNEIDTAIFLLPLVLMQSISSIICGRIISYTGHYFYVVQSGYLLWLLSVGLLILWNKSLSDGIHILILFIMGTGVGAAFQPSMVAVQANCKKSQRAVAISTRNVLRSLGGTVGIAIGSTIVSNSVLKELTPLNNNNNNNPNSNSNSNSSLSPEIIKYIKNHIYEKIPLTSLNLNNQQINEIKDIYTIALRNYYYFLIPLMTICVITAMFIKDNGLKALDEQNPIDTKDFIKRKQDLESSASSMTVKCENENENENCINTTVNK
ncbi:transporter of the Major Facilitator Superfamily (MFS), putative [Candida dubliniensis CD36]|uniref:Transporter of the Major Facilitator Superfamily (MFS), putative n=1 Tax=Candida dubliniensis (strain CD36 / ATCC MYA-646 / CBS 7987 / NCPF 3949 / NRRL Y-17841) TaxID=573826 RepID=B9WMV2_CANDC|nr:transporter of the Major Facilitator Superfamily (MFS), putative [Candida dubliniensis CD36]CAX40418.1 transporter of the Major Facilitator Superfamily (MFS), putative [Candida dubliniensis CD36]